MNKAGRVTRGLVFAATALSAAALAPAASAAPVPDELETDGRFAGVAVSDRAAREAVDFWTPERIARAKPLDTGFQLGAPESSPLAKPVTFSSEPVNPLGYPNRIHGRILMQFPNALPGYYSCSGTVTTSGSGSLVTTAGHCAYDFQSKSVATSAVFFPGLSAYGTPYGPWPVTNIILNKTWVTKKDAYDYDFAMFRVAPIFGPIQGLGSRGIGFNQPRKQRYQEYGYPAEGRPEYDGNQLIRCDSGYLPDPGRYRGPRSIGMRCDAEGGTSGGGWVSQKSFLVSVSSHGYPTSLPGKLFGPYFGKQTKQMYKAQNLFWPSIGPIRCGGEVASIVGTDYNDTIRGTNGRDVIATVGGNDRVKGNGGSDKICGGAGNDKIKGGDGKDKIDGGSGRDKCGRKRGKDGLHACE